jgi:hypothetical protein
MTRLDPADRQLLDFLCAVECNRHCIVRSVKTRLRPSLRRLRYAGLVWFDSYKPSASAIADWQARQSPPTPGGAAGEEPPRPKAADDEGGAVARLLSAPPIRKPARAMRARAERFEQQRQNTPGAHGTARKAPVAEESTSASRATGSAPSTYRCGHPRTEENSHKVGKMRGPVCAICRNKRVQKWREEQPKAEAQAFSDEPAHYAAADRQERASARRGAAIRRSIEKRALALVDGDDSVRSAGGQVNQVMAAAVLAIRERRAAGARHIDPVERAKLVLQRHNYKPVVSMAIHGGPTDCFQVGSRLNVTQDELLAMAERLAA